MEQLNIYNSLVRKKVPFEPVKKGFVGIYVCGPTVYDHAHIGHAKSYISFDVIVRYFRYLGYKVRYVQNITDVGHLLDEELGGEDRVLRKAKLEQLEPMEVVERYTRSYFEDMDLLNVERPDISPRASGHIPEQIELIEMLIEKGYAYVVNGDVYFDVSKFKDYGKLSGRNLEDMMAGARVEIKEGKKNPADFALWKHADPQHLMQWNSPWGRGYPGWHAECSVMATRYLGQPFDIHGGGLENMFPHHECEIAQSEAAGDEEFARYWIHNNMVTRDGQKMGKSLGNAITIKEAVKIYPPLAIRFFVLNSHYRSPVDFSGRAMEAAQNALKRIYQTLRRLRKSDPHTKTNYTDFQKKIDAYVDRFRGEMNDDFNTPRAIAALFDFLKDINTTLDKNLELSDRSINRAIDEIEKTAGDVLGLLPKDDSAMKQTSGRDMAALMDIILDLRSRLRKEKNFALADQIRDGLAKLNIEIKDTPQGTEWVRK